MSHSWNLNRAMDADLCNKSLLHLHLHFSTDYPSNWVWDSYAETVVMPTYLIAIIVSDYSAETAPDPLFRVPVKVCSMGLVWIWNGISLREIKALLFVHI